MNDTTKVRSLGCEILPTFRLQKVRLLKSHFSWRLCKTDCSVGRKRLIFYFYDNFRKGRPY